MLIASSVFLAYYGVDAYASPVHKLHDPIPRQAQNFLDPAFPLGYHDDFGL